MCLEMQTVRDQKLLNSFRKKGHKLVKGYKIMRVRGNRLVSYVRNCLWTSGWNVAAHCLGRMRVNQYKPVKSKTQHRFVHAGFHIFTTKPPYHMRRIEDDRVCRTVWFYADEVRAAQANRIHQVDGGTIAVNRALMRRAY